MVSIPIQYLSDIHLEFFRYDEIRFLVRKIKPIHPILILSGDIGNPFEKGYRFFMKEMSLRFEKIFLIAGNHEYYGNGIHETETQIRHVINELSYLFTKFV